MVASSDKRTVVANILPPTFVCTVVGSIWTIYIRLHLQPLLLNSNPVLHNRGVWQMIVSQVLAAMFTICFALSMIVAPGTVPNDPEWVMGAKESLTAELTMRELKGSTGDRRFCKWCRKYKPDRCHHCRICKSCVLKMDHHCPWIMNCVGFQNHKYFFLVVIYAVCNCFFICGTIMESVQKAVEEETPATHRFLLVLCLVLGLIMGSLMGAFLMFHTWLMLKGMSTIEFCEKNMSPPGALRNSTSKGVTYDLGLLMNIKAALGPRWWLWLVPISRPEGNGLSFLTQLDLANGACNEEAEPEWTGNEGNESLSETFSVNQSSNNEQEKSAA